MIKGDLYCKPCFLKVFKEKGSYASFGVKTLPAWKPGMESGAVSDGGVGAGAASPVSPDAAPESKAGDTSHAKPAATAAPAAAPDGPNLSSSDLPNPKCKVCVKTVYDQEKQVYDKTVWHIACFKCLSCKRRIDVKAVAMIQGDLYCKACFLKVFKEKGSYASFGPKTLPKWEADKSNSGGTGSEPTTPVTPDPVASTESSVPETVPEENQEPAAVGAS